MKNIEKVQRYDCGTHCDCGIMREHPAGDWIDHDTAIAAARLDCEEAERRGARQAFGRIIARFRNQESIKARLVLDYCRHILGPDDKEDAT